MYMEKTTGKVKLFLEDFTKVTQEMPGGFFIYKADETEEIIFFNDVVLDIFGCDTQEEFSELTGGTFKGMIHPSDVESVRKSITDQIVSDASHFDHVEYRIIRKDGSEGIVDDFGRLVETEEYGSVYYVFIQDVTENREIKAKNHKMEMELERERGIAELKDEFLFNVSHDIRTPMNAVMGFMELAMKHADSPERVRDDLAKAREAGRHMMSLIEDLLEMGSLRDNSVYIKLEETDLNTQFETVFDMAVVHAAKKNISLVRDVDVPECMLVMDAQRFRRIMNNLIDNAIKFTKEGGTVTVTARAKETSGSGYTRYEFRVADTGIGMSEEFMKRIYGSFEREENSTKSGVSGTGLGLSITKNLIDIMGGTISVKSKKGEGSVFTVALPLKAADVSSIKKEAVSAEEEVKAEGAYRILLVEDMEINRLMAEMVLKEAGFSVVSVRDGSEAVVAMESSPVGYFDLVLMDIQMPVMNGYEAARVIRGMGREDTSVMPIIALSANAGREDKRRSMESGMNAHISKPFDIAGLIKTINESIGNNSRN